MLSPRYPSSSSTCDSVEDNRFSTSAFCHEPFHPITLRPTRSYIASLTFQCFRQTLKQGTPSRWLLRRASREHLMDGGRALPLDGRSAVSSGFVLLPETER